MKFFHDPGRLAAADVQVVEAHRAGVTCFEVWEADYHLFDMDSADPEVLRAALVGFNAGRREGVELGRLEVQAVLRQVLGAASSDFVSDLSDRVSEGPPR